MASLGPYFRHIAQLSGAMTEKTSSTTMVPDTSLQDLQRRRKWVLLALSAATLGGLLVSEPAWRPDGPAHEVLEWLGNCLLLVCVLGRAWCTIYIGGRKKSELVQFGPYSITRNPLYLFSFIGAAGIGARSGSLTATVLLALACYAVFAIVVQREERFLSDKFGSEYDGYAGRVPRFRPRFSAWQDREVTETTPRLVLTSMLDGLLFFLAIPLIEVVETLHETGHLPVLFRLF